MSSQFATSSSNSDGAPFLGCQTEAVAGQIIELNL